MELRTAGSPPTLLRQFRHTRMLIVVDPIVNQLLTRITLLETALMDMWGVLQAILHMGDLISMTTSRITHQPSVQRLADLHHWTDVVAQ